MVSRPKLLKTVPLKLGKVLLIWLYSLAFLIDCIDTVVILGNKYLCILKGIYK